MHIIIIILQVFSFKHSEDPCSFEVVHALWFFQRSSWKPSATRSFEHPAITSSDDSCDHYDSVDSVDCCGCCGSWFLTFTSFPWALCRYTKGLWLEGECNGMHHIIALLAQGPYCGGHWKLATSSSPLQVHWRQHVSTGWHMYIVLSAGTMPSDQQSSYSKASNSCQVFSLHPEFCLLD